MGSHLSSFLKKDDPSISHWKYSNVIKNGFYTIQLNYYEFV